MKDTKNLLQKAFISQAEYSAAKKLIGFTPMNYIWNGDDGLYTNLKIRGNKK